MDSISVGKRIKMNEIMCDNDKHEYEWQRNFKVCKKCGFCGAWLDMR